MVSLFLPLRPSAASSNILIESSKRSWASEGGRGDLLSFDELFNVFRSLEPVEF